MCEDREVYIVGACRTAFGRFLGGLKSIPAPDLAAAAIGQAVHRAGVAAAELEEVILGCAFPAGLGPAPVKQAIAAAELPRSIGGYLVSQGNASGLKAVALAAQAIRSEDRSIVAAGGMESMSRAPHLALLREGGVFGDFVIRDGLAADGLWCAYEDTPMGRAAEVAAEKFQVSRADQDQFVIRSHRLAVQAAREGFFGREIARVDVPVAEGATLQFEADEGPRADMTIEKAGQYPAAFKKDGTVSAASASSFSDGAAALVLASDEAVKAKDLKPVARIRITATTGLDPALALAATPKAVEAAVADSGWKMSDVDLFEVHENFAVQPLVLAKALGLDMERINVHGGALALGDPAAVSGARLVVTLVNALRQSNLKRGVAALCLAGGDAMAMTLEAV